jgi:hypothetical protein
LGWLPATKVAGQVELGRQTDKRTTGQTNGQAASDGSRESGKQIDMADEQTEGKGSIAGIKRRGRGLKVGRP